MDVIRIERAARDLQVELWKNRDLLAQDRQLTPIELLCPEYAAFILDLEYHELPTLDDSQYDHEGKKRITAGLINFETRRVFVSSDHSISHPTRRFTAGHEIGHWILHKGIVESMHRDLPIDGSVLPKSLTELEANSFSAFFYMPARLVQERFFEQFRVNGQFVFNELTCFHLGIQNPGSLMYSSRNSLERELVLARCANFGGRHMTSLAQQFGVSNAAMARRIKELDLVRWP